MIPDSSDALFGESPAATLTRVRTSLEALVKRSLIERLRQGTGVFYQAGDNASVEEPAFGDTATAEAQD